MVDAPSRPPRLFSAELPAAGGRVELESKVAHHLRVLRLREGDALELFDGRGGLARASLVQLSRERAACEAAPRHEVPAPSHPLHLVVGLPKGAKPEQITRMVTELGASALHFARCERSVPRPSGEAARSERLQRVALEACAQSGQPLAPQIHPPVELDALFSRIPRDALRFAFHERARAADSLRRRFPAQLPPPCQLWAVVGPEGGFSAKERQLCDRAGFTPVSLGVNILRVETAAVVAAAMVLSEVAERSL